MVGGGIFTAPETRPAHGRSDAARRELDKSGRSQLHARGEAGRARRSAAHRLSSVDPGGGSGAGLGRGGGALRDPRRKWRHLELPLRSGALHMAIGATAAAGHRALHAAATLPIKCAGAPQKAMYLSCDAWRRRGVLKDISVAFHTAAPALFGVADYCAGADAVCPGLWHRPSICVRVWWRSMA